jgi:hypothetical protein
MLKATQLLLSSNKNQCSAPLIKVINRHGTLADSQELYKHFLKDKDPMLLEPIMFHGDKKIADDLYIKAIRRGELQSDFPVETFFALSYLEHQETEHTLFNYYRQLFDGNIGWDLHRTVCLSLLNYSCRDYKEIIEKEIEKCFAVHLFPEFIPALACKTDNISLVDRLFEHGCTKASSDASAGLILGLALFGEKYKNTFKSIIWNPEWEAASSATGNRHYTIMGMRYLGISLQELFQDLQLIVKEDYKSSVTSIYTFCDLLGANLQVPDLYPVKFINNQREQFSKIYQEIFASTPNSIIRLLEECNGLQGVQLDHLQQELYTLKELYDLNAQHELELLSYMPATV